MRIVAFILCAIVALGASQTVAESNDERAPVRLEPPHVVMLHGLGRSARAMSPLADRLEDANFHVHNLDYPSTQQTVAELVEGLAQDVQACCVSDGRPIHFVTHSMGGILLRAYLAQRRPETLGRVVMLSPPNGGTQLVDEFRDNALFRWATGPAAQELGTEEASLPNRLGRADFELGIITGNRTLNPIGSWLITGEDDGTVAVESARLEGMADFLVVTKSHTFIMHSQDVAMEVVHFLNEGRFTKRTIADVPVPAS
ncbi:MAG: alpha/beta fold hydrolase [bacterium]|nr:alpha/beta fold hydrolase [bacterium]